MKVRIAWIGLDEADLDTHTVSRFNAPLVEASLVPPVMLLTAVEMSVVGTN